MKNRAWLAGLALVVVPAASISADEWSHHYALKGRANLHVTTDDGSVRVETGKAGEIEARLTTQGWRIGSGEVAVSESQDGDRVSIEVRVPHRWHSGFGSGRRKVELVLQVPGEADLDVRTGDGAVEVEAVSGHISLSTGDGHITTRGLHGDLRLHTGDGGIEAQGLQGRLDAESGDGHINVRGRFEALNLRTGDGHIEVEVERGSKVTDAWSLRSGDGGIVLRVPDDLAADLEAHTGDGHIDLDLPLAVSGTVSRSDVRGKLGGGGGPLRLHTSDGSIRLQRP
jgi:Putative adhesin